MAFGPNDGVLFQQLCREREAVMLFDRVIDSQQALVVVMGESGAGKTSLLRAGLEPRLEKLNISCSYWEAVPTEPLTGLTRALGLASDLNSETLIQELRRGPQRCIILDHFEQIDPEKQEEIYDFIKKFKDYSPPYNVTLVIAFRREYLPDWADKMGQYDPLISLELFNQNLARDAMAVLAREANFTLDEGLVDDLLRATLQDGRIAPVEIGIGLLVLSKMASSKRVAHLSLNDYRFAGGSEGLLTDYLQSCLNIFPEEDQEGGLSAILKLADLEKNRREAEGRPISELAKGLTISPKRVTMALEYLASREVRLLERVETENETRYRLPHERLIPALRRLSGSILVEEEQVRLQFNAAFRNWCQNPQSRYMLTGKELRRVKKYWYSISRGEAAEKKKEFLVRSQRRLNSRYRWALVASAAIFFSVIFIFQWLEATKARDSLKAWGLPPDLYSIQKHLKWLEIKWDITDVLWLRPGPQELKISSNKLQDLKGLKSPKLQYFTVAVKEIADGNTLASLAQLQSLSALYLDLGNSPTFNLIQLAQLTSLSSLGLNLGSSTVLDLTPLAQLQSLSTLDLNLGSSTVYDLAPLTQLTTSFSFLSVDLSLKFTDLFALAQLQSLQFIHALSLDMREAKDPDLVPLKQLRSLHSLNLDFRYSKVPDLAPLAQLQSLRSLSLNLSESRGADLAILQSMTQLESLSIEGRELKNLKDLQNCKKLISLEFNDCEIGSLEGLPLSVKNLAFKKSRF